MLLSDQKCCEAVRQYRDVRRAAVFAVQGTWPVLGHLRDLREIVEGNFACGRTISSGLAF